MLREGDISCFVANWEPKDQSIRKIAAELNIGIDSLVFFDDNPAERALVRERLPEVTVPEVPEDPSLFVPCLDRLNLFDTTGVTDEDRTRAEFFQQSALRDQLAGSTTDYQDYLRRLAMRATVEPISEDNLARTTQLINKTNQFNLTTLRMTEAEVRAVMTSPKSYTSTIRLEDKFGNNGLISVVIGRVVGHDLRLDNWLMSCRVLKRGVEILEMERVVAFCKRHGLARVIGHYVPTAKNKLVQNHYADLGFLAMPDDGEGTWWSFDVERQPLLGSHAIEVV